MISGMSMQTLKIETRFLRNYRQREEYRKAAHDPLSSTTKQLSAKFGSSPSAPIRPHRRPKDIVDKSLEVQARLSRESSERQRALDLIRRKKREMLCLELFSVILLVDMVMSTIVRRSKKHTVMETGGGAVVQITDGVRSYRLKPW